MTAADIRGLWDQVHGCTEGGWWSSPVQEVGVLVVKLWRSSLGVGSLLEPLFFCSLFQLWWYPEEYNGKLSYGFLFVCQSDKGVLRRVLFTTVVLTFTTSREESTDLALFPGFPLWPHPHERWWDMVGRSFGLTTGGSNVFKWEEGLGEFVTRLMFRICLRQAFSLVLLPECLENDLWMTRNSPSGVE
jgi:hypothetical protein